MKAIITHDLDHITAWEHKADYILPKHVIRNFIELGTGRISAGEFAGRLGSILRNRWQNLQALMDFDREAGIPSTFFIAVSRGRGLSYSFQDARVWAGRIQKNGFDLGVHGIAYRDEAAIRAERERFVEMTGLEPQGIRMHYLKFDPAIEGVLNGPGYAFDSSICALVNPYRVGRGWEFPLHIMDGHMICRGRRWQNQDLEAARQNTLRVIDEAGRRGIRYLTVLFHDRYFSDSYVTWKHWYIWLISYLKHGGVEFTDFKGAMRELQAEETPSACACSA